jgi:peptide/nickel transport system substrate-binding protein
VIAPVVEGLTQPGPDGSFVPVLAAQVPTLENGGISADGKTVTYRLKPGVVFSDGSPLECEDVKYTWQVRMTPGVGIYSTSGHSEVESITCPDPLTVVIKFKNVYAAFQTMWNQILPRSAGDPKSLPTWAYNRKPIGTGPFKIDEWVADAHVTLSRNEKYREKDKPYLDKVIIRLVPSADVALQQLISGNADVMWKITEADTPLLVKTSGVKISEPPGVGGERMFLNVAENKDGADPTKPHLILGDARVRQAIAYGINKQRIIDRLLFGKAKPGTGELNLGFWSCDNIKPYPYDPDQAKKSLDAAGWVPGSDGIRVAKGAKFAPDGTRLRLKFATTAGNKLREDTQVLITEDMRAIGVEFFIENSPSSVLLGTWDAGSPSKRGNWDIMMYKDYFLGDPHPQMIALWASWRVPSEQNKPGTNLTHFTDPKIDELINQAATQMDPTKRRALYCQIAQFTYEQVNMIYLYQGSNLNAYRDWVRGWVDNGWRNTMWNAEDWWLAK